MGYKPKKYRKIPHVVEVMQWDGTKKCFEALVKWTKNKVYYDYQRHPFVFVETLEGEYPLKRGMFLIKGLKGEFYPHDEDIFYDAYEEIDQKGK